ncbi:MAG: hypothetical protein ACI81L_003680, partial [Verrucomicrobiales bacterium]
MGERAVISLGSLRCRSNTSRWFVEEEQIGIVHQL